MFNPSTFRFCTTQSIAAITWETSVAPSLAATFRLTTRPGRGADECLVELFVLPRRRDPRIATGDQPGEVGPVSVRVDVGQVLGLRFEREVGAVDHVHLEALDGADPGIDHRDVDAPSGPASLPHLVEVRVLHGTDPRAGVLVRIHAIHHAREVDVGVRRDREDPGDETEVVHCIPRHVSDEAIDDREGFGPGCRRAPGPRARDDRRLPAPHERSRRRVEGWRRGSPVRGAAETRDARRSVTGSPAATNRVRRRASESPLAARIGNLGITAVCIDQLRSS